MVKEICGYEGLYTIDHVGNVFSIKRNQYLKPCHNQKGYCLFYLYKDGKRKMFQGHRLVAEAFIPNPDNLPCVNHKDENKANNHVGNLEWCTAKYNTNYGTTKQRMKTNHSLAGANAVKRPVVQISKDGKIVNSYDSISDAARAINASVGNIGNCCLKKRCKTVNGFIWRYKEEII